MWGIESLSVDKSISKKSLSLRRSEVPPASAVFGFCYLSRSLRTAFLVNGELFLFSAPAKSGKATPAKWQGSCSFEPDRCNTALCPSPKLSIRAFHKLEEPLFQMITKGYFGRPLSFIGPLTVAPGTSHINPTRLYLELISDKLRQYNCSESTAGNVHCPLSFPFRFPQRTDRGGWLSKSRRLIL